MYDKMECKYVRLMKITALRQCTVHYKSSCVWFLEVNTAFFTQLIYLFYKIYICTSVYKMLIYVTRYINTLHSFLFFFIYLF